MSIRNLAPATCKQKLSDLALLGRSRQFAKGDTLFVSSTVLRRLYIVEKGIVALMTETEKGSLIAGYRQPGDIIGAEDFLLGEDRPCDMIATCRTPCTIVEVPFETLQKTATTEMMSLLGRAAASAAKNAIIQSQELAMYEVKERVQSALQAVASLPTSITHPKGVKILQSRQELALAVSSSRETVGRILRKMQDEGVISREGNRLILHAEKPLYRRA